VLVPAADRAAHGVPAEHREAQAEGDKLTSDGYNLIGYVATMDHRFWRYDPPPAVMVDGKPVVTEGPGTYGVLNWALVPPRGR
jgi:hypothetical protein